MNAILNWKPAFLALLTSVSSFLSAEAQQPFVKITAVLSAVRATEANDPSGDKALQLLTEARLVNNEILPYFYGIKGALHELSPERQMRINEVEQAIAPFTSDLLKVVERTSASRTRPNVATQLLSFAPASAAIKSRIESLVKSQTASPDMVAEAVDLLFMLQLDDKPFREEIIGKLSWRDELHSRAKIGDALFVGVATRWPIPEALDYFSGILSVPLKPGSYPERGGRSKLITDFSLAVEGLSRFGTLGASCLNLLKARLLELDLQDSDEAQLVKAIEACIARLEGRAAPEIAVSWKGQLIGVNRQAMSEWTRTSKSAPTVTTPRPKPPPVVQPPAPKKAPEAKSVAANEESTTSTPWSVIVVLIVAAAGLLWLLVKNRK
jgi:hypothetical protein